MDNGTSAKIPTYLKDYLGELTDEQMRDIRDILKSFRNGIRMIVGHAVPEAKKRCRELNAPCDRCFFSPKAETFLDSEVTTYRLIESLCDSQKILCRTDERLWLAAKNHQTGTFEFCRVFISFMLTDNLEMAMEPAQTAMAAIRRVFHPQTA